MSRFVIPNIEDIIPKLLTLNISTEDERRLEYLKSELKKRAFTVKSYARFLKKEISYHDRWLLLPYFKIENDYYLFCGDVLVWPPKTYFRVEEGKGVSFFFEPDVTFTFLRSPSIEILDRVKFPFIDSDFMRSIQVKVDSNVPSKLEIIALDSVAFYTTLFSDIVGHEESLISIITNPSISDVAKVSLFNLVTYIQPELKEIMFEIFKENSNLEISMESDENDELLLKLVGDFTMKD